MIKISSCSGSFLRDVALFFYYYVYLIILLHCFLLLPRLCLFLSEICRRRAGVHHAAESEEATED